MMLKQLCIECIYIYIQLYIYIIYKMYITLIYDNKKILYIFIWNLYQISLYINVLVIFKTL